MTVFKTFFRRFYVSAGAALLWLASTPALAQDTPVGQPVPWGLGLQAAASPMKDKMHHFHNVLLMPIITVISLFVLGLLIYVSVRFRAGRNKTPSRTTHNTMLEVIWTLIPVIILVIIVIPSMKMLYYVDRAKNPEMTIKVTGYQWYWGYEYPDHGGINFLSNMLKDEELKPGQPRLLATDNVVVLPVDTDIRVLVTANDVLHSWAMPALGLKTDAVPGRLNETWVRINQEGIFYGQCSEICGVNHGFMPIEIHAVSKEKFAEWVTAQGGKMPDPNAPADAAALPAPAEAQAGEAAAATTAPAVEEVKTEAAASEAPDAPASAETK